MDAYCAQVDNPRSVLKYKHGYPKDPTWEEHKNAERQALIKELMGGIQKARYADFTCLHLTFICWKVCKTT